VQYLDEIIEKRVENFHRFVEKINQNADFYPLRYDHIEKLSNFAVPVVCKSKEILNTYIKKFANQGIEIRPIVGGDITQQLFWKQLYGENTEITNAKLIHKQGFYFGNSPEYTEEEIQLLLSLI
jgi:CDP-6-deoxy-D-xylo-4-hexulose-3-dehydrase